MPYHDAIAHKKPPRIRKAVGALLVLAAALLQSSSPAWAVDRLSTGQSWYVLNETGIDLLGVQRLRITGPDADAFAIEGYTGSPAGMLPSQDVFTPALVQKTPSTPLGVSLRFTPQHSGSHQASLEVTHDGSNASPVTYPLTGAGDWDVAAQASTTALDFGERVVDQPPVTQDAFVRAVGAYGWLRVTGVKLEGSADFTLAQVGLVNKGSTTWGTGGNLEVPPTGTTESTRLFNAVDVSGGGLTDAAVRVRYTPVTSGPQSATLTVYHDGNGQGYTAFEISGKAYSTVVLTPSESPSAAVVAPSAMPDAYVGTPVAKSIYLRATGPKGAVTYQGVDVSGTPGARIVGVYSVVKGGITVTGANLVPTPGASVQFQLKGADVSTAGYTDLRADVVFTPEEAGAGQLDLTFHHNAPRLTTQVSLSTTAGDLGDRIVIQNNGFFRSWSDGTFAPSCEGYLHPSSEGGVQREYSGQTGSGVYRINLDSGPVNVYCEMDTDGGGWILIFAGNNVTAGHDLRAQDVSAGEPISTYTLDTVNRSVLPKGSVNQFSRVMFKGGTAAWQGLYGSWVSFNPLLVTGGNVSTTFSGVRSERGKTGLWQYRRGWGDTSYSKGAALVLWDAAGRSPICGGAGNGQPKNCPAFANMAQSQTSHMEATTYKELYVR